MLSLSRCCCCILLLKFINWHPVKYARAAAALLALWINGYLLTSSLKLTVESWNQQMDFMGFALILWRHETSSVGQLIRGRFKTDSWIWVEWQSSHHFESAQFWTETQFLLVVGFCRIDRRNSILLQYIICMSESTRLLYSSSLEELVAAVYWLFTVESRTQSYLSSTVI